MNKGIRILVCAALLGSAMLTGCEKNVPEGNSDKMVQFSVVTQGTPTTKTAYGDDYTSSGTTWQIINWVKDEDVIRISSDYAKHRYLDQKFADYDIVDDPTLQNGHESVATIDNSALDNSASGTLVNGVTMKNGLVWGEDPGQPYTFWGIYPSTTLNSDITIGDAGAVAATLPVSSTLGTSTSTKYVKADGTVTETQSEAAYTYTVYEPDMKYAYLTAATSNVPYESKFDLVFKPAFTAFEINLTSADDGIDEGFTVSGLELSAEANNTDYLAGTFTMTAGDLTTVAPVTTGNAAKKSVSVSMNKAITPAQGFTVTLFTIPKVNSGVLTLTVTTDKGPASLKLYETGTTAYKFLAGKKYRINLLQIGGRLTYAIELDPLVLPWVGQEKTSSFSENIQAKAISIEEGALEITDDWMNGEGLRLNRLAGKDRPGSNHYEAFDTNPAVTSFWDYETYMGKTDAEKQSYLGAHPTYYELYYQQRHMLVNGVTDPHFVITFTPMAPLAGYWTLKPESVGDQGGVEGFQFKILDGEQWQTTGWNTGQIMGIPVTIGIWPAPDSDRGTEYAMIVKAVFSTNKSGDPAYNADTEMQDVHGDGRYSYWKFILPVRE